MGWPINGRVYNGREWLGDPRYTNLSHMGAKKLLFLVNVWGIWCWSRYHSNSNRIWGEWIETVTIHSQTVVGWNTNLDCNSCGCWTMETSQILVTIPYHHPPVGLQHWCSPWHLLLPLRHRRGALPSGLPGLHTPCLKHKQHTLGMHLSAVNVVRSHNLYYTNSQYTTYKTNTQCLLRDFGGRRPTHRLAFIHASLGMRGNLLTTCLKMLKY